MAMPIVPAPTFYFTSVMTEVPFCFEAHGSIRKERTYQTTTVTIDGNMQHRRRVQLQYAYHKPSEWSSEGQVARQQVFADAVAGWQALDPAAQEIWNEKSRKEFRERANHPGTYKARSGFNLYISDYLKTH